MGFIAHHGLCAEIQDGSSRTGHLHGCLYVHLGPLGMIWGHRIIAYIALIFSVQGAALNDVQNKSRNLESIVDPPHHPTTIKIGAKLLQVFAIEPASKESPLMTAEFKLRIQWVDERLVASGKTQQEVRAYQDDDAVKRLNQIFDPKIHIIDGDSKTVHLSLHIFPDGTVDINHVVHVTVPANMDLTHFPFDSQTFRFRFGSSYWDDNAVDLSLLLLESGLAENAAPNAWHFDFSSYHVANDTMPAQAEVFSILSFFVHAQRNPWYFLWRLIIPLFVIVLLSWNAFWMFEDSSAALANCILLLLTVVTFHQMANAMLPMIPFFTFIDSIVFISYGFIIVPTFEVIVAAKLALKGKTELAKTIHTCCRWGVPTAFVVTMLLTTLIYFAQS
jgi:hypothetical protein